MTDVRYDRNMLFFGRDGQKRIAAATVAVVGVGGLGTHVVQQLALLGVGRLVLIDHEELAGTNRNRYVGVRHDDPIPGTLKVDTGARIVRDSNPEVEVVTIAEELQSHAAFDAIPECGYVFGCVDDDGPRFVLNELCSSYSTPYFDLASDVDVEQSHYGGRILIAADGPGCLVCHDEIDKAAVRRYLSGDAEHQDHDAIYGVPDDALGETGPSVVSINGVVASLGVTEFMLVAAGVREEPRRFLKYYGHRGMVTVVTTEPEPDCYYCNAIRGTKDEADLARYLANR